MAQVVTALQEKGVMEYTTVVAKIAKSPATLSYLDPYREVQNIEIDKKKKKLII